MVQGAAKVMPMLNSQIADLEKKFASPNQRHAKAWHKRLISYEKLKPDRGDVPIFGIDYIGIVL